MATTLAIPRKELARNWTSSNPILGQAEFGFESDTGYCKLGDGVTKWNNLAYFYHGNDLHLDQTTEQTVVNGTPQFNEGITIRSNYHIYLDGD